LKREKEKYILTIFLTIYFILNNKILTTFPFVHSDEAWLSGLSRNIQQNLSYKATEAFFDIKPRYPHGIKMLFHSIQIVFMNMFGYSIYSFRLISLIFGILSLIIFYKLSRIMFKPLFSFLITLVLSFDIQFIYASHFARQEIILVFVLLISLFIYLSYDSKKISKDILLGSVIGLSIGIHPNSFIVCLPFVLMYITDIFLYKKINIKNLVLYLFTLSLFAAFYIGFSFLLDGNFVSHYMAYGSEFDVLSPISSKFHEILPFYTKLYYGVSGTYYTPNIKFQLIIFLIIFIASAIILIIKNYRERNLMLLFLSILGINLGIILVGRFNQTSIIFTFPLFYLLLGYLVKKLPRSKYIIISLVIVLNLFISFVNIKPELSYSYDSYLDNIAKLVPKDSKVLSNLNSDYFFNNESLYDYRNLYYLKLQNMSFSQYIQKNNIKYIIYPEEMDFINQNRPTYNGLYGSLYYYEDMKEYLNMECSLIGEFYDSGYGIRIAKYIGFKNWSIKIYKVNS
jgi:4-amino-4-deoxy-L-arabinose transferase-like glycosyltransferase